MSTGENITNAVKVIQRTYENLSRMFKDLDEIANREGYVSVAPRFLRYKSDTDISGWMIGGFIKLYQRKDDPVLSECGGLHDGPIYGVDVTLSDEGYAYPTLTVAKYTYKEGVLAEWGNPPAVNEHWGFFYPTRNKEFMKLEEVEDGLTRGTVRKDKPENTYFSLKETLFTRFGLLSLTGREAIEEKIITLFEKLRVRNCEESF
jgi:hypothetical protein